MTRPPAPLILVQAYGLPLTPSTTLPCTSQAAPMLGECVLLGHRSQEPGAPQTPPRGFRLLCGLGASPPECVWRAASSVSVGRGGGAGSWPVQTAGCRAAVQQNEVALFAIGSSFCDMNVGSSK